MRMAFKEWAVVVDALGRGDQILILRKGGIHEGKGGFQPEHQSFFLFPTYFHQQQTAVIASVQKRCEELLASRMERIPIEFCAEVVSWRKLESLSSALELEGQHVWKPEVISDRFDWGREKSIFALALRVYRLPSRHELAPLPQYGGCKSWVELERNISLEGAIPVLTDAEFGKKLGQFDKPSPRHFLPA